VRNDIPIFYPQHILTNVAWIPREDGTEQPVVGIQMGDSFILVFSEDDAHALIAQIQLGIDLFKQETRGQ
jgi:hypothetical protein